MGRQRHAGSEREKTVAKTKETQVQSPSVDDKDLAYYKQFLDKDGGYKDKKGGYYNVKAGTYTDEHGGEVDSWGGYTYADGSYKSKFGDYYDAKANVLKTTTGETIKANPGVTPAEVIKMMRDDVQERGGYDKELIRTSMMHSIQIDHPIRPRQ